MASWLKAAEDLFEVVDRRAKLVVSELSDEQSDSQASASNGWEVKARKSKSKEKVQPGKTAGKTGKNTEAEQGQKTAQAAISLTVDKVDDSRNESAPEIVANCMSEASSEVPSDACKDTGISDVFLSVVSGIVENDTTEATEVPTTENNVDITYSPTNDVVPIASAEDAQERTSSSPLLSAGPNKINWNRTDDANPKESVAVVDTLLATGEMRQEHETTQKHGIGNNQENEKTLFPELFPKTNRQVENKTESSPMNVQDQIDEAQGLLKSAVSTGQSKEARLAKFWDDGLLQLFSGDLPLDQVRGLALSWSNIYDQVCAGLSSRLQEYKSENAQLEELLVAENELSNSYEARIKQLQQDLSLVKAEAVRVEANMTEALATKNTEIESLVGTVDVLKKQVFTSEGKSVSLQANMEAIMRSRELTESRMIQALREELAAAERRVEEERVAHNSTKMAAAEREVELEHRAVEASNALARIQRTADESTSRAAELEHKVALLEVEYAYLTQEIQELESCNLRGQKKVAEENSQILQIQAWQEEVECARQCQRGAENKLSSMEAELQKMRVEMAGMKRDVEHCSLQEHIELEKRYRELTDLLYHKQTQLEAMASEKAAAEFHLEKELKRLHEAQAEAERSRASRRSSSLWEEDTDIKALEPLPLHHRHVAVASIQLQRAAKLLDSGTVRATRFLWRYPVARVLLLCYLVFVHLFLMYLLHRLQAQAEDFSPENLQRLWG